MLKLLFFFLLIEFLGTLYIFRKDILTPAVAFNGIFLLAAFDLLLMEDFWDVELHYLTLIIIVIGTLTFTVVSFVFNHAHIKHKKIKFVKVGLLESLDNCEISLGFLNSMIIFYIITILGTMIYVIKSKGGRFIFSSLFSSYASSVGGDTSLQFPFFLNLLFLFCLNAGYAWGYLLSQYWVKHRKINIHIAALFILSCAVSIANGKRGAIIALVFAFMMSFLLELRKTSSKKFKKKIYFIIVILLIALIFSFQGIATALGRDSSRFSPVEYFSIYLGAPIMNLDTSIHRGGFNHPMFLSETFHSFYSSTGKFFHIDKMIYKTDRIFWSTRNGRTSGNVATTFFDFYHDGNMLGVIILTALMAFMVQTLYNKLKKGNLNNKMFVTILYTNWYWLIVRSFFANSFFDWFTPPIIQIIFVWWICSIIIPRMKIQKEDHSYECFNYHISRGL